MKKQKFLKIFLFSFFISSIKINALEHLSSQRKLILKPIGSKSLKKQAPNLSTKRAVSYLLQAAIQIELSSLDFHKRMRIHYTNDQSDNIKAQEVARNLISDHTKSIETSEEIIKKLFQKE